MPISLTHPGEERKALGGNWRNYFPYKYLWSCRAAGVRGRLWLYGLVIDSDIIDQAGPEAPGRQIAAGADVEAVA